MAKTYYEKLRDPRWQRKRLEIMERDGFACIHCGDKTKTLNVHHAYYESGKAPWEYGNWSLVTLCEDCHDRAEMARRSLLVAVSQLPECVVYRLAAIANLMLQSTGDNGVFHFGRAMWEVMGEYSDAGMDPSFLAVMRQSAIMAERDVINDSRRQEVASNG